MTGWSGHRVLCVVRRGVELASCARPPSAVQAGERLYRSLGGPLVVDMGHGKTRVIA